MGNNKVLTQTYKPAISKVAYPERNTLSAWLLLWKKLYELCPTALQELYEGMSLAEWLRKYHLESESSYQANNLLLDFWAKRKAIGKIDNKDLDWLKPSVAGFALPEVVFTTRRLVEPFEPPALPPYHADGHDPDKYLKMATDLIKEYMLQSGLAAIEALHNDPDDDFKPIEERTKQLQAQITWLVNAILGKTHAQLAKEFHRSRVAISEGIEAACKELGLNYSMMPKGKAGRPKLNG